MRTRLALTAPCVLVVALLLVAVPANAGLINRGNGMIYDDFLKITWLQDANYAMTNGDDADGVMDWTAANKWAARLSYGGYDDWRLPTTLTPCLDYGCKSSEMGHMFYTNLGVTANNDVSTGANTANLALFTNLMSGVYWSGTSAATLYDWYFDMRSGDQGKGNTNDYRYAWAVRDGNVGASPVPDPGSSLLLLGMSLVGLRAWRKRLG